MKISDCHLGFVGFGHMAQAIFRSLEQSRLIPRSQILFVRRDPAKARQNEKEFGITSTSLEHLVQKSDLLLIGVRPPQAVAVLQELARIGVSGKALISILAGIKLFFFQKYLGPDVPCLRAMPNIASEVGEGMSVLTYSPHASLEFRSQTQLLFSSMGSILEVAEDMMDISCAIAGSGPGFVFRLIESVARAGEKEGLDFNKALKMAAQAFAGAARLILKGAHPETLLQQITTKEGTTEAGLNRMKSLQIDTHLQSVIEAASQRSREISDTF